MPNQQERFGRNRSNSKKRSESTTKLVCFDCGEPKTKDEIFTNGFKYVCRGCR